MNYLRRFVSSLGRYELVAFVTGFALMAFELIAARLLAPSVGSSTYVWTSVIGSMIAALALGYAFGGWLADKRVAIQDIAYLLVLGAIAMAASLVTYDSVLLLITGVFVDARVAGVVAALVLFMPTSFLLGIVSPYLARLRVKSVATAGRSVASLSAFNSFGGIMGTFVTGFVFFSFIGSRESLALLIVALLACSWLFLPRIRTSARAVATGVILLVVVMELAPFNRASAINIDTPTSHYRVQTGTYRGKNVTVLVTGPSGIQSGVFANGSRDLVFPYTQAMAEVVAEAPKKDRIAMLGGGVFTLPEYLAKAYPESQIDVVEIDPQLEQIAKNHFGYTAPANVHAIAEDARTFARSALQKYDVILIDVFNEQTTPFSVSTREFTQELKNIIQPGGVIAVNIIGSLGKNCAPLFSSLHASYRSAFTERRLIPVGDPAFEQRQNIIGVYANSSLDWLKDHRAWNDVPLSSAIELTDNFAPTDALAQTCATPTQ